MSSQDAEQKLGAYDRGSFIFLFVWVILNPGFPIISYNALPQLLLLNKRGFYLAFYEEKVVEGDGISAVIPITAYYFEDTSSLAKWRNVKHLYNYLNIQNV